MTVVDPVDGSVLQRTQVTLHLNIRTPAGEPVTAIHVLLDGKEITRTRGFKLVASPSAGGQPTTHSVDIEIPPRDAVLHITVETARGTTEPRSLWLRWQGSASETAQDTPLPNLYVLAVGVSQYQSRDLRLTFPAKDAKDFADVLSRQEGRLYKSVQVKLLVNEQATKGSILDGLEWLQRQVTQRDLAIVFLAGHAINDPNTGAYVFLPQDADVAAIKRTLIADSDIRSTLASLAGKALLFLDTCHAGNVLGTFKLRGGADYSAFVRELINAENGVVVFASSTGRQSSREAAAWNNGAFTRALVEGLSGLADHQQTGRVTVNMLDLYVSERVKELTQGGQTPTTAKPNTLPDYPLAVVLPGDRSLVPRLHGSRSRDVTIITPRPSYFRLVSLSVGAPVAVLDEHVRIQIPEIAGAFAIPIWIAKLYLVPSVEIRFEQRLRQQYLFGYPGQEESPFAEVSQPLLSFRPSVALRFSWERAHLDFTVDPLGLRVAGLFGEDSQTLLAWEPSLGLAARMYRWDLGFRPPRSLWLFASGSAVVGQKGQGSERVFTLLGDSAKAPRTLGEPVLYLRAGAQLGF